MTDLYPGAIWRPSSIGHPMRSATLGVVEHWTSGHKPGDIATLDGPNVDCHFYVTKVGEVYQFLDPDSCAWHAFATANDYMVGIEHETMGEPWTDAQFAASAKLNAWLCKRYAIPVTHCDPSGHDLATFRGLCGHRDLSVGGVRVDGNDHTDTVTDPPGWPAFLAAVSANMGMPVTVPAKPLPHDGSLRLAIGGRNFAGWDQATGPLVWIARNGAKDPNAAIAWNGNVWRGPAKVTGVARHLVREFSLTAT